MRILFAHNYYQHAGGEDTVVASEMAMLEGAGHEVQLHSVRNDDITGLASKLRTGLTAHRNVAARDRFASRLGEWRPDIVHVHNFFPLLTPAIYEACNEANTPVVQTLHNYRVTCAGALLMRAGAVCEKCIGGSPYWGTLHRCYRGSLAGSATLSHMISFHRRKRTWHTMVDRFIALTDFARDKFIEAGLPGNRICLKPNFVPDVATGDKAGSSDHTRRGGLFVGRLSEEKGVHELVAAWRGIDAPLRIAGTGPLENTLRAAAPANVAFLGHVSSEQVREEMAQAQFLVVASNWYEGFPMVILEAFAAGTPVIVSKLGALPEIVREGETGFQVPAGGITALSATIQSALSDPQSLSEMGQRARARFETAYTAEMNLGQLEAIYDAARQDPSPARAAASR